MTVFKLNQSSPRMFSGMLDTLFNDIQVPAFKGNNPPVNILETKDAYILEFNAPGRMKESFNISLDQNLLKVSVEAKENQNKESVKVIRNEFAIESFNRTFTVDEKIASDKIEAKYENGILAITLPKKEEVKIVPQKIAIQ